MPRESWVPTSVVLEHLGVSRHTLTGLLTDSAEAGLPAPMVDVGRGRSLRRWRLGDVDAWVRAVADWRAAPSEATATDHAPGRTGQIGTAARCLADLRLA